MFHLWIPSIETLTHQRLSVFGTTAGDAAARFSSLARAYERNPGTVVRELVPTARVIALLVNPAIPPMPVSWWKR